MAGFPSGAIAGATLAIRYSGARFHDRHDPSDLAFGVWAAIVLIGLAFVSVALGVATAVDPAMFAAP